MINGRRGRRPSQANTGIVLVKGGSAASRTQVKTNFNFTLTVFTTQSSVVITFDEMGLFCGQSFVPWPTNGVYRNEKSEIYLSQVLCSGIGTTISNMSLR